MTPTYELREGQEFRVVQAFEDEKEQVFWLRTDLDSGGAWFLDRRGERKESLDFIGRM